ncbi:hypothetical protein WJX77_002550 [Trebouxia sp. C0004]
MPFPYNNIIDGPPFERLVAISIACTAHLFSAGVTSVPGELNALQLARDHHQVFRSTQGGGGSFDLTVDAETCLETAGSPEPHLTWDDPNFLVFMDSMSGPPAPSGDLRLVVKTLTGKLQVVIVQCKKLRACFERWNARGTSVPVDLVYVWATTARASPKLLEYACQQQDLIVVHRDVIMRMCPLLAIAPELYSARPLAPLNPRLQVKKRHIMHQISSLAYNAGCTQQYFVQRYV